MMPASGFSFPQHITVKDEPLLKALSQLKAEGKTRFLGAATHNNCEDALRLAADSGIYDIVMTAYNFTTENKETMNEALAYAAGTGIGILAMKTTAGGFRDKNRTYQNTRLAKANLKDAGFDGSYCQSCSSCRVKCTAGFDIKEKIRDISRLREVPDEFLSA